MKILGLSLAVFLGATPFASARAQTSAPSPAAAASPFADPKSQASYAIGLNLGQSLRRDSVAIDPDVLARGMRDGLSGAKPTMTDEQMRAALVQLQQTVMAARQAESAKLAAANQAAGGEFLKTNGAKPGVVTLPSGLQYQVLTAGKGPKPAADDTVSCNYRGTLIDGTEFDSSYGRGEPLTIAVGGVIKGWTQALQLMPVGSKWRLFVPSDLAYGAKGAGKQIGPNATLIFEVELLSIKPKV